MVENPIDLYALAWPVLRLGEALELTAQEAKLASHLAKINLPALDPTNLTSPNLEQWINVAVAQLGFEAEAVETTLGDLDRLIHTAAPAILRLPATDEPRFLFLIPHQWDVICLTPDAQTRYLRAAEVSEALRQVLVGPWLATTDQLLASANVAVERRARARLLLIEEQLGAAPVSSGWLLRLQPGASVWRQARQAHLLRPLLSMFTAQALQQNLTLLTWGIIGWGTFQGHFDRAWLFAWALLLFTAIPFTGWATWAAHRFSIGLGAIFKQRLIHGALKLQVAEIRHQGAGQFLGRVLESEAVELLALNGSWAALTAFSQLALASGVISFGAGGWLPVVLLWLWVVGLLAVLGGVYRRSRTWIKTYRDLTNDLVENMVGHRTRLAQATPHYWHYAEDTLLEHYLELSQRVDQISVWLNAVPRTWLIAGMVGLVTAFISGPTSVTTLAFGLGGLLLAYQALDRMARGAQSFIQLALTWEQVAPMFHAAGRSDGSPSVPLMSAANRDTSDSPMILAKDLYFRYHAKGRTALRGCHFKIFNGDRLLLEGPSGGGKTTLAALLAGLHQPEAGTLLLHGYDWRSLGGEAWRQVVVLAPQFHENHVFTETFGFNLLMGRNWPPTAEDLQAAADLCHELGLDDLLKKMPSGMQQIVGEGGWQLSHGERSRLFIARALLQKADLIILDESFGALDPENLRQALQCTLKRAPTLLVIAHP